jgi:low affinity Fe/Cu permease
LATSASGSSPGFWLAALMILVWLIAGPAFDVGVRD